jgi:hypothetical protein
MAEKSKSPKIAFRFIVVGRVNAAHKSSYYLIGKRTNVAEPAFGSSRVSELQGGGRKLSVGMIKINLDWVENGDDGTSEGELRHFRFQAVKPAHNKTDVPLAFCKYLISLNHVSDHNLYLVSTPLIK